MDFARPGSAVRSRRTWKFWTAIGAGSVAALAAAGALAWLATTILVLPSGGTGGTSTPTPALVSWSSPEKIGSYSLDDTPVKLALDLHQALLDRGLSDGVAASYKNSSNGLELAVWGAGGAEVTQAGSPREKDALFADIVDIYGRGLVSSRVPASPGAVGGVAECGVIGARQLTDPTKNVMACAWVRDGAVVGVYLTGYTPERAGEILPDVLSAVVHVT
jgi:hypothetical protein